MAEEDDEFPRLIFEITLVCLPWYVYHNAPNLEHQLGVPFFRQTLKFHSLITWDLEVQLLAEVELLELQSYF
ncbi:MAG: hypothetical protein R3C62_10815 [Chloroflexota bacterium]